MDLSNSQTCSKVAKSAPSNALWGRSESQRVEPFVQAPVVLFTRHSSTCSVALMMPLACKACLGESSLADLSVALACQEQQGLLEIHQVPFFVEKSSLWEKNVFSCDNFDHSTQRHKGELSR
jgi:hypothetical protein